MAINYWDKFDFGCCYHLYNRSSDHESIFLDDDDYQFFLSKVILLLVPYCKVFAYCIMPNHFHFIIKVNEKELIDDQSLKETSSKAKMYQSGGATVNDLLADQLRRLFSSVGLRFNHKYNKIGAVFAARSKRVFIANSDRLRYLILYTHNNPIHHGYADKFESWKYSSYKVYITNRATKISRSDVHSLFGSEDKLMEMHKQFKLEKANDNSSQY